MINHSRSFVDEDNPEINTEKIEGTWHHAKIDLNPPGGTRDEHLGENLDAWLFPKSYMTDKRKAFHILCSVIKVYGEAELKKMR